MVAHRNAQTFARVDVAETCTAELATVDSLSVGLSLQVLARQRHMPPGTAEIYARVGKQLEAAARLALAGGRP